MSAFNPSELNTNQIISDLLICWPVERHRPLSSRIMTITAGKCAKPCRGVRLAGFYLALNLKPNKKPKCEKHHDPESNQFYILHPIETADNDNRNYVVKFYEVNNMYHIGEVGHTTLSNVTQIDWIGEYVLFIWKCVCIVGYRKGQNVTKCN